jgi:ABC-type molybdenum transport system ATPase subunit/photorepair protein PhrA
LSLDWKRNDVALPSLDEIRAVWQSGGEDKRTNKHNASRETKFISTLGPVLEAKQLKVQRDDTILMDGFDWKVMEGDRWLLAGGNGSCKSTLSRLLTAQDENAVSGGHLQTPQSVGWVSTELHMSLTQSTLTGREVLLGYATPTASQTMTRHHSPHVVDAVASWLELGTNEAALLDRPFQNLSQGEQKMVLIGAAMAGRPEVLVLDEPCQGLDLWNRRRVLKLVEQLCQATRTTLVYITHHLEEVIPSVTHVLHLHKGATIYNGPRSNYDPTSLDETTR